MKVLSDQYLSREQIEKTGLLSYEGVEDLFRRHDLPGTSAAEKVQMDAVINHLIGVQILHKHFVETDIPVLAQQRAQELGWAA